MVLPIGERRKRMNVTVVVPTIREECIGRFLDAWEPQFRKPDVRVIVMEDHQEPQFHLPDWVEHYSHADAEAKLGEKASCIARRSGACNAFGIWLAAQQPTEMIVCLDDDCLPLPDVSLLDDHWAALRRPATVGWFRVADQYTRGFPYLIREKATVVLNHGLWAGVPDLDAIQQAAGLTFDLGDYRRWGHVPRGCYFPMSGMNLAFRREFAPFVYFWNLPDGMKRWADIWCGLVLKRIADVQDWAIALGMPLVRHDRASNIWANLRQEAGGYEINEELWSFLDEVDIRGMAPLVAYTFLAAKIGQRFPALAEATGHMRTWASLWEGWKE